MAAAALFGKRSTRFRHVYGLPAQKENCYDNIRVSGNAHDSMFCAVNRQFLAVVLECAGGGGFTVLPIGRTGRIEHNAPKVCGHSAPVMDIKWNPFNDNIIASASDDATVKLWEIPRTGLRSDVTRWSLDLRAHARRVAYIEWHPTAENILLSAGFDHQAILWNCEMGSPILVSQAHPDVILSLSWNRDGSLYASTCKDRTARIIDPRSGKAVLSWEPHQGTKTTKIAFLGDTKQLFTTGFSQFAQRQYGLWDTRSLNQGAVKQDNVDSASGALFPFYDHDTRMVYLAGKGDGNIRYYELTNSEPFVYYLSEYQSPHPQRGLGVMPKLGLDTAKCEIFRFYKLHSNRPYCEPISMIAPRKAETFQEDLYPPTAADRPALSAIEWIGGTNRDPILVGIRDPKVPVNCPPMVTSRPVPLSRLPNQPLAPPPLLAYKPSVPLNGNGHLAEIDENSLPQSVRNIRKLVGGMYPPAEHSNVDLYPAKLENGHSNAMNAAVTPGSHNHHSFSSHHSSVNGDMTVSDIGQHQHRNGLENGFKIGQGHSDQSLQASSRGSDSVFERSARKSETERAPSPNGEAGLKTAVKQQVEQIMGSTNNIPERLDAQGEVVKQTPHPAEVKGVEVITVTNQSNLPAEMAVDGSTSQLNGSSSNNTIGSLQQPHPPGGATPPSYHHHHNVHQIRHDDVQAAAMVPPAPSDSGGAFRPVVPQRHPPPPLNLTIPNEKPVSAGFVVQTAVASPISPSGRFAPQQENLVPSSQKVIQKMPLSSTAGGLDTQQASTTAEHNFSNGNNNNNASDVPLASPQFRRGASGGNAYQPVPQQQQNHQQPQANNGIVRSPSGRATRPDILDVLQEQLSASSRELRGTMTNASPTGMHQAVIYSKGPSPQAAHLLVGPPGTATSSGRNSRNNNNMSPAERRIRNRTIGSSEGNHAFLPVADFTSPGLNYASPQRSMQQQQQQQIYYQPLQSQHQGQGHHRRPPPPIPQHPVSRASLGVASGSSSRSPNVAIVDVRDDMAPSIMRPSHQSSSPPGLNRSQTMYIPVADNNGFIKYGGAGEYGPQVITMPISSSRNGNSNGTMGLQFSPVANGDREERGRPKDRSHRPRRDLSAAAVVARNVQEQQQQPSNHQRYQHQPPQQQTHQPRLHQKISEDSYESMADNDLRSYCRRQRDEIRLLRRQCEAKDQVISRLEGELRHLAHQLQQRHGIMGGAGAQVISAVGP